MVIKHSLMYFIAGLIFGVSLMWGMPEKNIAMPDEQLDKLSSAVIESINLKLSENNQVTSNYESSTLSADSVDISYELIDKLKSELTPVIIDELNAHQSEVLAAINNRSSEKTSFNDQDYQQYYQTQSMLDANGNQMTFEQFASDENFTSLPVALRNKLMGEVAMKLTSGELSPEEFLAK